MKGMFVMKIKILCFLSFVALLIACSDDEPKSSQTVIIKPEGSQVQLDNDVATKYEEYKRKFLKSTPSGNYFIYARGTGDDGGRCTTQSEAHGYGMIIFALMADYDSEAKKIFDGMNQLRKAHPSTGNKALMSWVVFPEHVDNTDSSQTPAPAWEAGIMPPGRRSSATDGDFDMAYALLLAYKQWNNEAYLEEAKTLIEAMKKSTVSSSTKRTKLGDWQTSNFNTRTSDWMPGHFREFYNATGDAFWLEAADTVYSLLEQISNENTGLMPDFATGRPIKPDPTGGGTTGEHSQAYYASNACRVPWRLALDYAHYGTVAAKTQIDKISSWLYESTDGKPDMICSNYQLDGTCERQDTRMAFVASFASGMIANSQNQQFLNDTYELIIRHTTDDVYNVALQLLNMLFITGNWWSPYAN